MNSSILEFGDMIKKHRYKLNMNQKMVSILSGVSINTLREIENGRVIPKIETLNYLSPIYKINLIDEYSSCLLGYSNKTIDTLNRIESKIIREDFTSLYTEINLLQRLLELIDNEFLLMRIKQTIFFIQGIIDFELNNKRLKAASNFHTALKIGSPSFCLKDFRSFYYSDLEKRIIIALAIVGSYKQNEKNHILTVADFLSSDQDTSNLLQIKLLYYYGIEYLHSNQLEKANGFIDKGIQLSQKTNQMYPLAFLGLVKAKIKYRTNCRNWSEYLFKINNMRSLFGQRKINIIKDKLPLYY